MISSFTVTAFKYFELMLLKKKKKKPDSRREILRKKKYFSLELGLRKGGVNEKILNY